MMLDRSGKMDREEKGGWNIVIDLYPMYTVVERWKPAFSLSSIPLVLDPSYCTTLGNRVPSSSSSSSRYRFALAKSAHSPRAHAVLSFPSTPSPSPSTPLSALNSQSRSDSHTTPSSRHSPPPTTHSTATPL